MERNPRTGRFCVIKRESPHRSSSLFLNQNKKKMVLNFCMQKTSGFFQNRHPRSFCLDSLIASRNRIKGSRPDIAGKKVDSLYATSL